MPTSMPTSIPTSMMGEILRRSRFLLVLPLALLAAACGESTAPDLALDTDAALADYDAVESLLASSDWQAFQVLGGRTPFSGSAAGVEAVAALGAVSGPGGARAFATELSSSLAGAAATAPARAPIISEAHRGVTFVYDPETDEYVVDPEREGAPATGVRFVLYEVDFAGIPILEEEIGHADLVDEGDGSTEDVALRLTVVTHEHTVLDHRTTLEIGLAWGEITVSGFLEDRPGGARLDFAVEARGEHETSGGTLDIAFELGIEARGFSIIGSVSGAEEGGTGEGDVTLAVTHRRHTLDVDMTGAAGELDGAIYLDGELFATVTGNAGNPTITSADGDPLTSAEALILYRVVDLVEDVFDLLEDLVDPVDELVLMGLIL